MMSEILEGLNPSQMKAALAVVGINQITAVAGSGKTHTLTKKLTYMIKEKGIKPRNVLVTTFTKKATEEMKDRLAKGLKPMELATLDIGTTHSICYRILKKEYGQIGHHLAQAFTKKDGILGGGDSAGKLAEKKFLEEIRKSIIADMTVQFQVKEIVRDIPLPAFSKVISGQKNDYIDWREFERKYAGQGAKAEAYIEFYKRYEKRKWAEGLMDMDDLLFNTVRLFQERKDILAKYQSFYKYVMVDEAQDNNLLQYMLIKMVAAPENNIFIVGDDDQSMYGFRGARPDQFINLGQFYPNVNRIDLEDNYRSNPEILMVANKLIANNTNRLVKSLKAHKKNNDKSVFSAQYNNETEEAEGVVKEISMLLNKDGMQPRNVSILYRTNAQSRSFEEQLIIAGLPYVIHGGISFYERKEVKDVISYLRLAVDQKDNEAFKRIFNTPTRYLGKAFLTKCQNLGGMGWYEAAQVVAEKSYERQGIDQLVGIIEELESMVDNGDHPTEMIDYILYGGGYEKYLMEEGEDEDEGSSRLENISTLKYALQRFTDIKAFFSYMEEMTSKKKQDINGVQLMTIHKSKGLEFPAVFVVGASEGLLPHFKSIESADNGKPMAIEEERRLMYVAVTRAESILHVTSTGGFNGKPCGVSRFVREMELVEQPKVGEVVETYSETSLEGEPANSRWGRVSKS